MQVPYTYRNELECALIHFKANLFAKVTVNSSSDIEEVGIWQAYTLFKCYCHGVSIRSRVIFDLLSLKLPYHRQAMWMWLVFWNELFG